MSITSSIFLQSTGFPDPSKQCTVLDSFIGWPPSCLRPNRSGFPSRNILQLSQPKSLRSPEMNSAPKSMPNVDGLPAKFVASGVNGKVVV